MSDSTEKPEVVTSAETALSGPTEPEGGVPPTQDQMAMQMIQHLAGLIAPFCPNTDEQALLELGKMGIAEQSQIHEQIMPTLMVEHEQSEKYPGMRIVVQGPNGREGAILAPKRLENVDDAQPGIAQAMMVAFLLTPSVRMVLKAWGFRYRIEQVAEDPSSPAPTLHTV